MKAFLINGHQPYPGFSEGKLNETMLSRIENYLVENGWDIRKTKTSETYDVKEEIEKHVWADLVVIQMPVNWMGAPWSFKKYMDEVYSAGMDGTLSQNDGRHRTDPKKNYGAGGALTDAKYFMSVTFNAPEEAFNDPNEFLFQGKAVDDVLFPQHLNMRFFGMKQLDTFACFDVLKDTQMSHYYETLDRHLRRILPPVKA